MRTLLAAVAALALWLAVPVGAGTAQASPLSAPGARVDVEVAKPTLVHRRYRRHFRHYGYYRPFRYHRYHYRPYRHYGYYRPYRKHFGFSLHFGPRYGYRHW